MTLRHKTPPRIDAPSYASASDGTMIHRYMGTDFVDRFLREAQNFTLPAIAQQNWRAEDRFGKHGQDLPTLRLPLHNTFYMVCAEVCCDEVGYPALDPRRVEEAGFVIRRGTAAQPLIWQLKDGAAIGWRAATAGDADPDERRRLANVGLLPRASDTAPFSGEEVYPMRPLLVDAPASPGSSRQRKRTLLHGFLPLAGTAPIPLDEAAEPDLPATLSGRLVEHQWPFGSWDGTESDTDTTTNGLAWTQQLGLQVLNGRPEAPFFQLLRSLVEKYRVQEGDVSANARLRQLCSDVQLRTGITGTAPALPGDLSLSGTQAQFSLLSYLEDRRDDLIVWIAEQDVKLRDDPDAAHDRLPGLVVEDLYFTEAQAQDFREALVLRGDDAERDLNTGLPVPRFRQGPDEIFFVRPFVRWIDNCGCERLVWGPASQPFRVVSPLDPEASVPNVIQMPDLDDLRRGVAKGVTCLTPKSLMDAIDRINPDMEIKEKKGRNALSLCLSYSLSFSIPAITICAMILLMIMLSLLNFFLQWLPWVFLRLSLKCK